MRLRRFAHALVLLSAILVSSACGSKPATPPAHPPSESPQAKTAVPVDESDRPLPLDARITHGTLPNGLTYYVLPHKKPENRAQIWLAVNAGSVLEDDDQRGLAHFVEHMGFNGTRRFPKQALVDFVERSGVRFGADLNAYTNFDETVYTLQVPTDNAELLGKGISVLRDWADGMTFDREEVEKERGVVLEEWRLGRGAWKRLFDKQAPVLFFGSKYAERITIGKPEIIKGAPRDTLVRYYKDWYRPDLMAVIAVGDFGASDVEARIKSEFGSLPAAKAPKPRPTVTMPPHDKTLVTVETDPEMPATRVALVSKIPHRTEKTPRDLRRMLTERLFNGMLNARFDEIRRQPNAPFLSAASSVSSFGRSMDSFEQSASAKDGGADEAFGALLEEVLRVERHGFTAGELDRAKSQTLRYYQQLAKERDKRDSRTYAEEIVRHFLKEEAMAGIETELALLEKALPTIKVEELNQLGKKLREGSRVISVIGPAHMAKPTTEGLLALAKSVEGRTIKPYDDSTPTGPLVAQSPAPGAVVKTTTIAEIGVTEWTLKNGVKVVLKPTTFANDDVRLSAFSPGGHSLVPDAAFDSARFADTIVGQGGLGAFDAVKLRKLLAGKIANVSARVGELDEGVWGQGSPADLETMLELVHLSFTAPRRDEAAFTAWKAREIENVKNRRLSPEATFAEDLTIFQTQNHLRRRPTTPESLARVDLDKALAIYKERFADAGDFTFVIVGNVDLEKTKPLVETWLGSLPAKGRKETWRDPKVSFPDGIQSKTLQMGTEPKSQVSLLFHGPEKWTRETENDMRMLGEILSMRLREILREDMGGVYGVSAGGFIARRPRPEYTFAVRFGCSPENVDKLTKAVWDEIRSIQEKGIGADYTTKVKELRRRSHESNLKENTFWGRELERAYTYGDDPRLILDIKPMLEKVDSDHVKGAARKYLLEKRYILGVLRPNAGPP